MVKHPTKFIIFACLVISIISVAFVMRSRGGESSIPESRSYTPPVARANPFDETAVQSPDGKLTLKMREEKGKSEVTYVFMVTGSENGSQKEVFRKTLPSGTSLSIPFNTFSPDNKYLFLKEAGMGGSNYFVLSTAGTPLDKDSQFLEFSSMFEAKYPVFKITDVTGWGGVSLIVINTDKSSGGVGPSFWFDVASRTFIQLSNRVN